MMDYVSNFYIVISNSIINLLSKISFLFFLQLLQSEQLE